MIIGRCIYKTTAISYLMRVNWYDTHLYAKVDR